MLGLVLGTLRLPLIVLATGGPPDRRGHEHRGLGGRCRGGGLKHARDGRVDWHIVADCASVGGRRDLRGAARRRRLRGPAVRADRRVPVWSGVDLALRPIAARPRERMRVVRGSGLAFLIGVLGGAVGVILGRFVCRRSSGRSAWTSAGPRGPTSSSASFSGSPASRRMPPAPESTGPSSQRASPGRSRAAGSARA